MEYISWKTPYNSKNKEQKTDYLWLMQVEKEWYKKQQNKTTIAKNIYTYTKEKHASNICNYGWLLYNKQQSLVHSQGKACPIIHSDTTSPLQSWSTYTSFCSHGCKRQFGLHPPHHFAVWFAPFSWKPICKTLPCKPFHARRPSPILWKGKRILHSLTGRHMNGRQCLRHKYQITPQTVATTHPSLPGLLRGPGFHWSHLPLSPLVQSHLFVC